MSFPHLIVIALIALVVLGPEKLPQVARTLGKAMAEFRRITGDFRSTVENEMREIERVSAVKDLREGFPVHYDVQQMNEETARTAAVPPPPAEFTGETAAAPAPHTEPATSPHVAGSPDAAPAKKTEEPSSSGNPSGNPSEKLSNGQPTPA